MRIGALHDLHEPGPVCGKNGLRLLYAPPAGGRVVLFVVSDDASGIRAVDRDEKDDVARVRQWVMRKLDRWGYDGVRADVTARRWLGQENGVVRVEGRKAVQADPREGKTENDYARGPTKILNRIFPGKGIEGTVRGVKQEKSVGPVRTRWERLDDRKLWQNLGLGGGKFKKIMVKANGKSEDLGEGGHSAGAAIKKGKKSPVETESDGKGKGVKK